MIQSYQNKLLLLLTLGLLLHRTFATRHFLQDYIPKINLLTDLHLTEEEYYPVIHAFIDKKISRENEWPTLILSTYSKRIPIVLTHANDKVLRFASSNRVKFHYVIGIFQHMKDVNLVKWRDAVGDMWNPRIKFVIWIVGEIFYQSYCKLKSTIKGLKYANYIRRYYVTETSYNSKERLFNDFWNIGASANVVMITFNSTSQDFDLSGYDPFYPGENGKRGIVYPILKGDKMFPEKFTNLYGYPIRISMFQNPPFAVLKNNNTEMKDGEDVEFFWILQSYMNFSLVLLSSNSTARNYEVILPSGERVGPIGDILMNRSEILGNSRFVHTTFERNVEFLYPFDSGAYNAIVPHRQARLDFTIIGQNLFNRETILHLIPVFILTIYLHYKKERYPIFNTWNIIINHEVKYIGKMDSERLTKLTWIIYTLLITCVFETRLIILLTKPYLHLQLNSLRQLNSSNLTLMVGDKMLDPIIKSSLPIMQDLAKKTKLNLNYTSCTERLLKHGDVACASDKLSSLLSLTELWDGKNNTFKVHLMEESIGNFWVGYAVKKNSPYLDRLDVIQRRIVEAGLESRTLKNDENIIWKSLHEKTKITGYAIIKLWHLESTFLVCLSWFGIAFIIFIQELYFGRKRIKWKKRR